ncbi:MAG: nuclear transport factor 2 family protein [Pseudomonadota bacterium]
MRTPILIAICFLLSLSTQAFAQSGAEDTVRAFINAVSTKDRAMIERVLAPEFQIVRADGSTHDRASYLASELPVVTGTPVFEEIKVTEAKGSAVMRFVLVVEETIDGEMVARRAPRLATLREVEGAWLLVGYANFAPLPR